MGKVLCCRSHGPADPVGPQLPHRNRRDCHKGHEGAAGGAFWDRAGGFHVQLQQSHLTHCALADCSITKFLNRILGLEVDKQNMLFQYFSDTFDYLIEKDKKEGKYDMGILGMEKEGWSQLWGFQFLSVQCPQPAQILRHKEVLLGGCSLQQPFLLAQI